MYEHLAFIKNNLNDVDRFKFSDIEYEKFFRVVKYMETTEYNSDKLNEGRKDFINWFLEYDKRRGTDFSKTFPHLVKFMELCNEVA